MRDVVWSSEAWRIYQAQLERVLSESGLDTAVRSRDRFEDAISLLGRRPLTGRPSLRWADRREKSLLNDRKIILYSHDETTLKIVYLADSRQDLDAVRLPDE